MKISKRLLSIIELIPNNSTVIDVGCDHGYLSIYLSIYKNCICTASDINKNVINNTIKNIKKFNLENDINVVLTSGLENIKLFKDEYIVIAGMGTYTALNIILSSSITNQTIIIQSNNYHEKLRTKMIKNGYEIINEIVILEKNKYYPTIVFRKGFNKYTEEDMKYGPLLKLNDEYYNYIKDKELCLLNKKSR